MPDKKLITDRIVQQGILPLYFNASETVSIEVLRAIYRAGIRAVEYTNRGEAALNNFKKLIEVKNIEMQDMFLGVGTIKSLQQAESYINVGADFLVSPGLIPEVIDYAGSKNIFYAPGCMTPSEIIAAENRAITFIKLFPGNLLGPEFVSSVKEIFPKLLFMPTGGVDTTKENLEAWFRSGVCAVGMGSKLISKKLMEQKDYAAIEEITKQVLDMIQKIKLVQLSSSEKFQSPPSGPPVPVRTGVGGKYRWTICALLFFATTVNYLDRQVLSLLQPYLADPKKFNWSNTDYANITAVFQFVYAFSMLFAGRIIDKLGTKKGYVLAIIIWSIAAITHAFAIPIGKGISTVLGWAGITVFSVSVLGFMFSRAFLAVGEAGNFPAAIKATSEYFPKKERSFATGIFNSGTNVGAILAPLTVPWIKTNWGWETAFIIMGGIGFLWLIFWFIFYEEPGKQKRLSVEELNYINGNEEEKIAIVTADPTSEKTPWIKLLGYKQTWAFTFGKFMTDGIWWFFLFWLPAYLKAQYGMVDKAVMLPLALLYTMAMFGSIAGGWFPTHFIKKGYQVYDGRMKAMLLIAFFPLVVLAAQPLGYISYWIPIFLIGVGASAHQAWSANIFTTVSDMFPKKAVGSVVGIGGMAGGLGGVVTSKLGGALFDHYKALGHIETGYSIMFAICAVAYLVAWIVMKLLVPRYKPITDL